LGGSPQCLVQVRVVEDVPEHIYCLAISSRSAAAAGSGSASKLALLGSQQPPLVAAVDEKRL
jgi:hypothetical protein